MSKEGDGGDVFVVHAELAAGFGVELEEGERGEFAGKHPVVRLEDDEGELAAGGEIAGEEGLFRALDIDLEEEGGVAGGGLAGEDGGEGEHLDGDAFFAVGGAVAHVAAAGFEEGVAVVGADSGFADVDVETYGVLAKDDDVVR